MITGPLGDWDRVKVGVEFELLFPSSRVCCRLGSRVCDRVRLEVRFVG